MKRTFPAGGTNPGARGTQAQSAPTEFIIGNVKVGYNGIVPVKAEDALPPTVNIDDLVQVRELGKGACGSVSLYRHATRHQELFAVKKINIHGKDNMSMVAAEIRRVFVTPSPYAVRLHNGFLRNNQLLLVMEYMDWGNLEELLEVQPQLPEPCVSYLAGQLLHALAHLHKKQTVVDAASEKRQIHRDVKPANVLLSRQGTVKLADFGVAASADTIGVASFVGTVTYMSPERIKGQRYGVSSDVWSVGIVIAQALLGQYPFQAPTGGFMALLKEVTSGQQTRLPPGSSPEAQSFIDACLRQEPEERPSAESLLGHPWITRWETEGLESLKTLLESVGDATMRQLTASSIGRSEGESDDEIKQRKAAAAPSVPSVVPTTPPQPQTRQEEPSNPAASPSPPKQ